MYRCGASIQYVAKTGLTMRCSEPGPACEFTLCVFAMHPMTANACFGGLAVADLVSR